MNRTAKTTAKSITNLIGEVVRDRSGKTGVVTAKHSKTQVVVNYGPGVSYVMYATGLVIVR